MGDHTSEIRIQTLGGDKEEEDDDNRKENMFKGELVIHMHHHGPTGTGSPPTSL